MLQISSGRGKPLKNPKDDNGYKGDNGFQYLQRTFIKPQMSRQVGGKALTQISFDLTSIDSGASNAVEVPQKLAINLCKVSTVNIGFRNHPPSEGSRFLSQRGR